VLLLLWNTTLESVLLKNSFHTKKKISFLDDNKGQILVSLPKK
jgi:hypothetical protein